MRNFWDNIRIFLSDKIKPYENKKSEYVDTGTGEAQTGYLGDYYFKDNKPFIKDFEINSYQALSLSDAGRKAYFFLTWAVRRSKDTSYVNLGTFSFEEFITSAKKHNPEIEMSLRTCQRGLKNLEENDFIIRQGSRSEMYQVNPALVFNGDRVKGRDRDLKKNLGNKL